MFSYEYASGMYRIFHNGRPTQVYYAEERAAKLFCIQKNDGKRAD